MGGSRLLTFAVRGDTHRPEKPFVKRSLRFAKIDNFQFPTVQSPSTCERLGFTAIPLLSLGLAG